MTWRSGGPKISVTVNCSSEEFNQPGFKHDLLLTMTRVGIDPHTLRLEVNEAALLGKPEQTRIVMNELRDLGIRIGIDDFGTGFSSLAFLHRIPLDLLKIDHSFVHNDAELQRNPRHCPNDHQPGSESEPGRRG